MKSKSLFNSLLTGALGLTGIGIASLIPTPQKAVAAWGGTPTCPAQGNSNAMSESCYVTPETMEIKFYELGFCTTTSPLSGANFSRTNCEKAWESAAGETVDLATFSYSGLASAGTSQVPAGTYQHAYAIVSNIQGLKGKAYFNDQTYYTTSDGTGGTDANDYGKYNLDISSLAGGSGCWDSPSTTTSGYGTTKAYLADDDLVTATNTGTCDAATRFIGSIELSTPVTISSTTKTYSLTWTIADMGLWINYTSGIHPSGFGSGPFLPIFTFE